MQMALTDTFVKQVRWGTVRKSEEKRLDSDGMHLLVKAGVKYWRISLTPLDRQKTLALVAYPSATLLKSRKRRVPARELLEMR